MPMLRNSPFDCCLGYIDSVQTKLRLAFFKPETYYFCCTEYESDKKAGCFPIDLAAA